MKRPWSVRAAGGADTMRLRPNLCTATSGYALRHGLTVPAKAIISPVAGIGKTRFTIVGAEFVTVMVNSALTISVGSGR